MPPNRNHRPTILDDVVTGRVFIGRVHGPLEHGAAHHAGRADMAAPDDGHAVVPLEPVVVAHKGNVALDPTGNLS